MKIRYFIRSKINIPLKIIEFLLKTCVIVSEWIKLQKGVKVQTGKYFKINERTRYLQAGNLTRNKTELIATHYRRSPLFQGGLEIPCIVKITMPVSVLGYLLLKRYEELILKFYCKPMEEIIMGSFIEKIPVVITEPN